MASEMVAEKLEKAERKLGAVELLLIQIESLADVAQNIAIGNAGSIKTNYEVIMAIESLADSGLMLLGQRSAEA